MSRAVSPKKGALRLAIAFLDAFQYNSSYEDYIVDEGIEDEDYEAMLEELRKMYDEEE